MATGVNSTIIGTSKYYKIFAWLMIIFVFVLLLSNFLLIPVLGITGAALASAISTFIFNFIRFAFLYNKFNLQPFNLQYLTVFAIGIFAFLGGYYLPKSDPFWLDLITRSILVSVLYLVPIYLFKISIDINNSANNIFAFLKRKI